MSDATAAPAAAPAPRPGRWPMIAVIAFGLVLLLPLCVYQVRTTEVAIKTTFGEYQDQPIPPGAHLKLPWPIQKVHRFDNRLRVFVTKYTENATADEKNLILTLFTAWQIEDPAVFLAKLGSVAEAERILADQLGSVKDVVVRRHPLSHFISTDPAEQAHFRKIEEELLAGVQPVALKEYGVRVALLGIERIALPASTTEAVLQRMASERGNRASVIRNRGQVEAQETLTRADLEAKNLLSAASAEATAIRTQGDTAAAKEYDRIKQELKDPANLEFVLFVRKLEALEAILQKKTTLILDRDVSPFDALTPDQANRLAPPPKP